MAFLCLDIDKLNKQQGWLIFDNNHTSLFLPVVSYGSAPIFDTQPYIYVAIGFLTAAFTKYLLGLGGGQRRRRQILQISYKRTITYDHYEGTDIEVEDLAGTTDVNKTSLIKLELVNPSNSFINWFCCQV